MTSIKVKDVEVYREYTKAKNNKTPIGNVLTHFGISRSNLYDIIRRVKYGNPGKVKKEMERARLAALWEHKYKARFLAIPKNRNKFSVQALCFLIRDMHKDDFPTATIAAKIGKDRSTILWHLEN